MLRIHGLESEFRTVSNSIEFLNRSWVNEYISLLPSFFYYFSTSMEVHSSCTYKCSYIRIHAHNVIFLLARSRCFERSFQKRRGITRHLVWRLSFLRGQLIEISPVASFLLILIFRESRCIPPSLRDLHFHLQNYICISADL